MNPTRFRALLDRAGLKQVHLVRLLGVSKSTANRWCSDDERDDQVEAPRYAVAFVIAYSLLPEKLRAVLARQIEDVYGRPPEQS